MKILTTMAKQAPLIALAATLAAVTACSNAGNTETGKESPGSGNSAAKPADTSTPYELSAAVLVSGEPPSPDNDVEKRIEQYTNTKLNIQWIPSGPFEDKINIMIASGELPKAIMANYTPAVINAVKANQFWEIGPFLKDYPNLSKIDEIFYSNTEFDGKRYGLPRVRPITRDAFIYRKDWMDRVGVKPPKNLDEFYQVLKAFKDKDPDQNGKDDHYPYFLDKDLNGFDTLVVLNGGPNGWAMMNGKMTPNFMTKEFMDVLKLHKRMFDEKLMNDDFAVAEMNQLGKLWNAGRVGMQKATVQGAYSAQDNVRKSVKDAEVDLFGYFENKRVPGGSDKDGFFLFPKSSIKDETELKRVLAFFEKICDPEMVTLFEYGLEGVHYKVENGKAVVLDNLLYRKDVKPFRDNINRDRRAAMPAEEPPLLTKGNALASEMVPYAVFDQSLSLNSKKFSEVGGELLTIINDARVKFIMGKIDEAGWAGEIERWKNAGGNQVIEEYTEAFNKVKGAN